MGNEDGSVWICYNGEVYGWSDAARELASHGAPFRTHSDTEFILRGYEAWGIEGLLPRLRGMFAFALVDFRARRVHVVRDRMGLKPVVYAQRDGTFAFGSTVRSVLPSLAPADREFSAAAIDAYLAHRYVPAPRTIFTHIARLPNAHRLEYAMDSGRLDVHRYWSPQPSVVAGLRRAARRGDRVAAGRRPAARPVPVRRHRLGHDRVPARGDGAPGPALVLRRLSRVVVRRKRGGRGHGGRAGTAQRTHRRADDDRRGLRSGSSRRSTSRSRTRRRSRRGTSRARPNGT